MVKLDFKNNAANDRYRMAEPTSIVKAGFSTFRLTSVQREIARIVETSRPEALRKFDQIPMQAADLIQQCEWLSPRVANKSIAFVGDYDGTSIVIGLIWKMRGFPSPKRMLILDFDERLLYRYERLSRIYGFASVLDFRLYNVFEPIPADLEGQFDWYYTNPPYGSHNEGASGRLFITRGSELTKPHSSFGSIILPDDQGRGWSELGMLKTQQFLSAHGWYVNEKIPNAHRYYLDDDPTLRSSLTIVKRIESATEHFPTMPWASRQVPQDEIPAFYGRSVVPPYPSYIREFNPVDDETSTHADAA